MRSSMLLAPFAFARSLALHRGVVARRSLGVLGGAAGGGGDGRVPVTLLSGFLGAGKTSLLRHLLAEAAADEDLRVGVLVNDMAAVNVDAKLVRRPLDGDPAGGAAAAADFVEIGDGCICCSMADELFASLASLNGAAAARGFSYDHVVVEASGIAEPRSVRDQFQDAEAMGAPVLEAMRLDTLVTVVDAAAFLGAYSETRPLSERDDLRGASSDAAFADPFDPSARRSVVDLLVEQIECADVVLINKCDLVSPGDRARVSSIVGALNAKAEIIECEHGATALTAVLGAAGDAGAATLGPVDEHKVAVEAAGRSREDRSHGHDEATCDDPTHDHSHGAHGHDEAACAPECDDPTHDHSHGGSHSHGESAAATSARDRFGIESFVYARRRPFAPERLEAVLAALPADASAAFERPAAAAPDGVEAALAALVRSKGFLWLAASHDTAYYWSHAGAYFAAEVLGRWWATLDEKHWPEDLRPSILSDFDGDHGDRRQEIVFIGVDAVSARPAIEAALDACLLDDAEFAAYESADEAGRASRFPSNLRVTI